MHGIQAAKRSGASPNWMWFGIHPLFGWVAFGMLQLKAPFERDDTIAGMQDERPSSASIRTAPPAPTERATTPPPAATQVVRLWSQEDKTRRYVGEMLERHLERTLGCREPVVAYLSGTQRAGSGSILAIVLLIPLLIPLAVLFAIPGWIFFGYRTVAEWRQAREAGVEAATMIATLVLMVLIGIAAGGTLVVYTLRRVLGLSHIFLVRTQRDLALVFCPMPLWVPRLGRVETCPLTEARVTIVGERRGSAVLSVDSPRTKLKLAVALGSSAKATPESRASAIALRKNLDAILQQSTTRESDRRD